MNIFYLDADPSLAARYHTDKHVVKMILESAQLLCTAVNQHAGQQVMPYKSTHINHPSAIWVREGLDNFAWLYELMLELNAEWKHRYGHKHDHLSVLKLKDHGIREQAEWYYPDRLIEGTPLRMAVPESCVVTNSTGAQDPVASYRKYYNEHKRALFSWTKRSIPPFITQGDQA